MASSKQPQSSKPSTSPSTGTARTPPWLRDYVYVLAIKRFVALRTGTMYDKEQFTDRFGYVGQSDHRMSAAKHFLHGGLGQKVDRITFRPGKPPLITEHGAQVYNAYRPPDIQPTHGSVQLWLDLGAHVIPDEAARTHHLRFFAHLIQHPDAKINHGLLCISLVQGIGKDSWFAPITRILGALAGVITPADLTDPFNDYLYEKLLLIVEELNDFGQRLPNKLKPLLAKPPDTLRINRKGTPQFDVPNVVHSFLMSNALQPLQIEASDRRFHVYESPATTKPPEYYARYYRWLADHLGDVYGYLQQYSIEDFSPHAPPPMTGTKQILIAASEPLLEQFVRPLLEDLPALVKIDEVRSALPFKLQAVSPHRLAACLRSLGAAEAGRVRLDAQERPHIWALRDAPVYEVLSEGELKRRYQTQHLIFPMEPAAPAIEPVAAGPSVPSRPKVRPIKSAT